MSIDGRNGVLIGDTDVVGLNAYKRAQLVMHVVHDFVALAAPTHAHEPKIGELRRPWRRNVAKVPIGNGVGVNVGRDEQSHGDRYGPPGEDEFDNRHSCGADATLFLRRLCDEQVIQSQIPRLRHR